LGISGLSPCDLLDRIIIGPTQFAWAMYEAFVAAVTVLALKMPALACLSLKFLFGRERLAAACLKCTIAKLATAEVAEKVARCKHAALNAVKLAGDISTRSAMESMSLDELLVRIKTELTKLAPLIDLEAIREPRGSRTERGLSKSVLPAGRSGT
jgi:hypothetical protein